MRQFIAIESSSGKVIYVTAETKEKAYHVIGRVLYGMPDPIDSGNVDVDLFAIVPEHSESARYMTE